VIELLDKTSQKEGRLGDRLTEMAGKVRWREEEEGPREGQDWLAVYNAGRARGATAGWRA
jgi:hypothetical protein